jgi:RNA polymerase sigma-70 factor, ECF subfamily
MSTGGLHQLSASLYERLRAIARARMAGQRASHTLDPTGLANEAIVRLLKCDPSELHDDDHFVRLAAEAMRQILIDHARAKAAQKRGGGARPVSLDDTATGEQGDPVDLRMDPDELLGLNDALASFERDEPEAASIVKLRTFGGMDCEEIAALIGSSKRTVERRWRYAMAELRARIEGDLPPGADKG